MTVQLDKQESTAISLLQFRAKLYAMESEEFGWKERGVGVLEINVPKSRVSLDDIGQVILGGSFDASLLDDEKAYPNAPRGAQLIMRHEVTHRVLLNTIIFGGMGFTTAKSSTQSHIIFATFEWERGLGL